MKKIAVIAIVFGLLVGGTVLASSKENSPVHYLLSVVQILEEKLASLEERVDNIKTTPGPQGEQGEQGEQGLQGEKGDIGDQGLPGELGSEGLRGAVGPTGPQGEVGPVGPQGEVGPVGSQGEVGPVGSQGEVGTMGPSLKVVDNTGVYLGYVVNFEDNAENGLLVFDTNVNVFIKYDFLTGNHIKIPNVSSLSYTSSDCSGTPLIGGLRSPYRVVTFRGNNVNYSPNNFSDVSSTPVAIHSVLEDSLLCYPAGGVMQFPAKVYPIEIPSYVGPISIVVE